MTRKTNSESNVCVHICCKIKRGRKLYAVVNAFNFYIPFEWALHKNALPTQWPKKIKWKIEISSHIQHRKIRYNGVHIACVQNGFGCIHRPMFLFFCLLFVCSTFLLACSYVHLRANPIHTDRCGALPLKNIDALILNLFWWEKTHRKKVRVIPEGGKDVEVSDKERDSKMWNMDGRKKGIAWCPSKKRKYPGQINSTNSHSAACNNCNQCSVSNPHLISYRMAICI